jgi:hypothetical protein
MNMPHTLKGWGVDWWLLVKFGLYPNKVMFETPTSYKLVAFVGCPESPRYPVRKISCLFVSINNGVALG